MVYLSANMWHDFDFIVCVVGVLFKLLDYVLDIIRIYEALTLLEKIVYN